MALVDAAPDRRLALLQASTGVAALLALAPADPAGRVLLAPAGVLLVVLGVRDLVLRPVLAADPTGLRLVDGWHRRHVAWSQVQQLRVVTDRRAPLLELDLGTQVVVLSRRRLGRPPREVLAELEAARP